LRKRLERLAALERDVRGVAAADGGWRQQMEEMVEERKIVDYF